MTRSGIRARAAAVVAAVALLVLPSGTVAGAHETEVKTKAVLDGGGPSGAYGHIAAAVKACLGGRRVSLFRETDGPDQSYGYDMTNRAGEFRVDASLLAGMYYVKVKPDSWGEDNSYHDHRCLGGRSIKMQF